MKIMEDVNLKRFGKIFYVFFFNKIKSEFTLPTCHALHITSFAMQSYMHYTKKLIIIKVFLAVPALHLYTPKGILISFTITIKKKFIKIFSSVHTHFAQWQLGYNNFSPHGTHYLEWSLNHFG